VQIAKLDHQRSYDSSPIMIRGTVDTDESVGWTFPRRQTNVEDEIARLFQRDGRNLFRRIQFSVDSRKSTQMSTKLCVPRYLKRWVAAHFKQGVWLRIVDSSMPKTLARDTTNSDNQDPVTSMTLLELILGKLVYSAGACTKH
jgi:hypothetical protein